MSGLPSNLPSIAKAQLPVAYQKAKAALATCTEIDECKDWADKAAALASYAKQAQDDGLRKMADRIQARAIRRCGQLLQEIERKQGARSDLGPAATRGQAARDARLSPRQAKTALRVARVPDPDFDAAVESDDPPTVTALAERGKLPAPLFDLHGRDPEDFKVATDALGWLERVAAFCAKHEPKRAVAGLLPKELNRRAELSRQATAIAVWLTKFDQRLAKEKP